MMSCDIPTAKENKTAHGDKCSTQFIFVDQVYDCLEFDLL